MSVASIVLPRRAGLHLSRRTWGAIVFLFFGVLDVVGFGLAARSGDATFGLSLPGDALHLHPIDVPAGPTAIVAGVLTLGLAALWLSVDLGKGSRPDVSPIGVRIAAGRVGRSRHAS